MHLLLGPPGSGKTSWCLARLREGLRSGASCSLLLPTTTLAEHLRNQLAREGFVFSPRRVSTFGKYVQDVAEGLAQAPSSALEILCARVLKTLPLERYAGVSHFPGFRSAIVRAVEEFGGAGGHASQLVEAQAEPDFVRIYEAVLSALNESGLLTRASRLRAAAARIRAGTHRGTLLVAGFFSFTPPEIEILKALDERADLTVTLPEWPGAADALRRLEPCPAAVTRLTAPPPLTNRVLLRAPTLDTEAVEIARRILDEHAAGRAFRDFGVIVRSEIPCVPALRTAFERFGIPARFYFSPPLESHATIRFFRGIIASVLSGWDHAQALVPLRGAGSQLEWCDGFDFGVRARLPGKGLEGLRAQAPESVHWYFDELQKLSDWATGEAPPRIWTERFSQLPALLARPRLNDRVPHDIALTWRVQAIAVEHFLAAVREAAAALPDQEPIDLAAFWAAVETVIASASLHVIDRRRDVVHVIDAVEARQWRLPVIFVAGLLETQFPKHHSEDAILGDDVRVRLQRLGVPLQTSAERQAGERFLFDQALTRATDHIYLSYSQLNSKGEPNLVSFFLERARPFQMAEAAPARPQPSRERAPERVAVIHDEALRQWLGQRHSVLSASSIEAYLTCPFNLFATRTLKLREPPDDPWNRLNILVQGNIGHRAFELHFRDGVPPVEAFQQAFAEYADEAAIPDGYRTEAVRLELLHGIEMLIRDASLPRWNAREFEQKFEANIEDLKITGKIDRLEYDSQGNAFIIDYKYQNRDAIAGTVAANEQGKKVQAGLYAIAAEAKGLQPVGVVFCGFRNELTTSGWVVAPHASGLPIRSSPQHLRDLMAMAREKAIETRTRLLEGRIAPAPENEARCPRCSLLKICRVDARPAVRQAGGQ